ncbi:MAG: type II toxin-antitoxin system HicB family antitoxin [Nitrospirae bacterium]|nr:type II toxin-antitoxin system HicB family antitoxin [Nitrospirota bacterium]
MKRLQYPAVITGEDNDYIVEFPDLKGCITDGDSIERSSYQCKRGFNRLFGGSF